MRTESFRYTEWDNGKLGVELYCYENDPGETHNVVKDAKYAKNLSELKELVRKNWENEYRPSAEDKKKSGKGKKQSE